MQRSRNRASTRNKEKEESLVTVAAFLWQPLSFILSSDVHTTVCGTRGPPPHWHTCMSPHSHFHHQRFLHHPPESTSGPDPSLLCEMLEKKGSAFRVIQQLTSILPRRNQSPVTVAASCGTVLHTLVLLRDYGCGCVELNTQIFVKHLKFALWFFFFSF